MNKDFEIQFETRGKTYFKNETSISFTFDGEEYWFSMIEEGDNENAPEGNTVEFESEEDLPFELTEEMKDRMYELAWNNPTNLKLDI